MADYLAMCERLGQVFTCQVQDVEAVLGVPDADCLAEGSYGVNVTRPYDGVVC